MSRGFASSYRIVLLAAVLLFCFGALGLRLVCLHVVIRDDFLRSLSIARHQIIVEQARRGDILDARGMVFATSESVVVLGLDPMMLVREDENKLPRLAALLGTPVAELGAIFAASLQKAAVAKAEDARRARSAVVRRGRAAPPVPAPMPGNVPDAPSLQQADRMPGDAAAKIEPTAPGDHRPSRDVQHAGVIFKLNQPATAQPNPVAEFAGDDSDEAPGRADKNRALFQLTIPDDGRNPSVPRADLAGNNLMPADLNAEPEEETKPDAKGRRPGRWVKLGEAVSESTGVAVEKLGIHGVYGQPGYRRIYPGNQLAAHLIGYVDRGQHAMAGMEFYADFYLRGQNGWRVGERDGRNRELAQFRTRDVPRADGYGVTLSINSTVQDIVEQELAAIAKKYQPLKATIIVSDPRTGFVLGMGNYPTFNLNEYSQASKENQSSMRNVAVADIYEPGSVFKIVPAAGALEEALVTPGQKFNCAMETADYKGRTLKLPGEDHRFAHDELTVAEIISHSSNRGAAQMGMLLGEERLYKYARAFGFGSRLGFPVGGEVAGILYRPEKWNPIDITRIPMGQSVSGTALQMHMAMSVIASGGVLLRPQIIRQIRDASGEAVYRFDRVELGRAVSERTAQIMAAMLMGVASKEGTAFEAAIPGYDVAGKTGTAQKYLPEVQPNGTTRLMPSHQHHVASFVGFFPAGRPQVAISVIVDDADALAPNGHAYGAKVAAPSFKHIGEQLIPILDLKPSRTIALSTLVANNEGGRR